MNDNLHRLTRRKRLGQVFLHSPAAIARIISSLELNKEDVVLEIGAGDGRLSTRIAPLVRRLFINELDMRFVDLLRRRFEADQHVTVVPGDILSEETIEAVRMAEPGSRLVVYGSLPYYITSPILRWTLDHHRDVRRAVFLVQREVAQRITAESGSRRYGFLSVLMQRRSQVSLGPVIRKGSFRPIPKVDSQLVFIVPHAPADLEVETRFEQFISALFQQRRKKMLNPLRAFLGRDLIEKLLHRLARKGLSLDQRPESLLPQQLDSLFRIIEVLQSEDD